MVLLPDVIHWTFSCDFSALLAVNYFLHVIKSVVMFFSNNGLPIKWSPHHFAALKTTTAGLEEGVREPLWHAAQAQATKWKSRTRWCAIAGVSQLGGSVLLNWLMEMSGIIPESHQMEAMRSGPRWNNGNQRAKEDLNIFHLHILNIWCFIWVTRVHAPMPEGADFKSTMFPGDEGICCLLNSQATSTRIRAHMHIVNGEIASACITARLKIAVR